MKARTWLRNKTGGSADPFQIVPEDGGVAGSLVGLGFLERLAKNAYRITVAGQDWLRRHPVRTFSQDKGYWQ